MHFVGPDQLHGFEERLTTDIYPADFGWTPDYRKAGEPIAWRAYVNNFPCFFGFMTQGDIRKLGYWRRDRDSNPGDGFPPTHFPGVRLRPLGHLSNI